MEGRIVRWNHKAGKGTISSGRTLFAFTKKNCSPRLLAKLAEKSIPPGPALKINFEVDKPGGKVVDVDLAVASGGASTYGGPAIIGSPKKFGGAKKTAIGKKGGRSRAPGRIGSGSARGGKFRRITLSERGKSSGTFSTPDDDKKKRNFKRAKPPLRDGTLMTANGGDGEKKEEALPDEQKTPGDGDGSGTPMRTIEAMPQLEITKEIAAGREYRMEVSVNQGPAQEGADVQIVSISAPANVASVPVDVWFDCSSHFTIDDIGKPPVINIQTATGVSDALGFTLKAQRALDDGLPMFVSAFFRYQGRPSGRITRYLEAAAGSLQWKKVKAPARPEGEVVLPRATAANSVSVETGARPADIRVEVLRTEANDGRQFRIICITPQDQWEGPWNLPQAAKDLVKAEMQTFMQDKGDARVDDLKGAGMALWRALPLQVRLLLLNALEKGAQTMSVITEEPYLPWELMVPYRTAATARQPLGVELQMGRWATGAYQAPPQRIPLKNAYVVAPKDSGLAKSPDEVKFLTGDMKEKLSPADLVTPATYTGVKAALSGPPRDVIHFICHGKSAALQTLELEKPDTINCEAALSNAGFVKAFSSRPLAFLNACEVGGTVATLDGVGGFAHSFIELGASAVIAPLWAVQDQAALNVTHDFYTQALQGVPFAAIMKDVRARAYAEAVDSYAAYCFYGDPMAKAE